MLGPVERRYYHNFLANGDWFGALPPTLQQAILENAQKRSFSPRQLMVAAGQPPLGLWIILQGQAIVSETLPDGSRFILNIGGPGFVFGMSTAFGEECNVVDVMTTTQTQLLLLRTSALRRMLSETPDYYRHFTRLVAESYHATVHCLARSRSMSPEHYLRYRLSQIAELWRRNGYQDVVELVLSQAEAADLLGVSRQTLNRYLAKLEADGFIEVDFRTIRILNDASRGGARGRPAEPPRHARVELAG